jgi:hypothetical protein
MVEIVDKTQFFERAPSRGETIKTTAGTVSPPDATEA